MKLIAAVTSACLLILNASTCVVLAADALSPTVRGDQYLVAAAKTYNMHANDHARLLGKYAAASDKPVAGAVIKNHVDAIRANTNMAKNLYDRLSSTAKNDPLVSKQLAAINARLAKVNELVDQLEAQSKEESTESKDVIAKTDALSQELKATHMASKAIDNSLMQAAQSELQSDEFADRQSSDYFSTGEGHFLD